MTKKDVNESFKSFLNIFETLLDTYTPVVPISNAEKKLKLKPWITMGILISIKKKNIIHRKANRAKDPERKTTFNQYKKYKNIKYNNQTDKIK